MPNHQPARAFLSDNYILDSLSASELDLLTPEIERVDLSRSKLIFYPGETIEHVYFPATAMISVVAYTSDGQSAEVGVIGREGVAGYEIALGGYTTPYEHVVQVSDGGWRMPADVFKRSFDEIQTFQDVVLAFTRRMMQQIAQTALCNRLHTTDQRLARWLLMCRDRAEGDTLPLTQEFLAKMLGSDRVTVNQAAGRMQDLGLISYGRGNIRITDRERMRSYSCDCYGALESEGEIL